MEVMPITYITPRDNKLSAFSAMPLTPILTSGNETPDKLTIFIHPAHELLEVALKLGCFFRRYYSYISARIEQMLFAK
jgi:hypothetical protein